MEWKMSKMNLGENGKWKEGGKREGGEREF